MSAAMDQPLQQQTPTEQPPQPAASGTTPSNTRPIKPEEQALLDELQLLTQQYGQEFPNICQFVQKEADRIAKGFKSSEEEKILDLEGGKPIRMTYKVTVPTEKYPNFNYVGRLLGPKGSTLRGMQEISGCRLAVLGKGSMKDKDEEEKCRNEGGKYAHLNEPLHVWMQANGTPDMVFYKLYVACKEIKRYLHADYNDEIFNEQMALLEQEGGLRKGFTAARAAPRGVRGGTPRGMLPGRGGPRGMMARGMPHGAPAMTNRGGMRGGGMMRGRGAPRGMRGGRGMPRGVSASSGGGGGMNTEAMYEDVYEAVPPGPPATTMPYSNSYINGSSVSAKNSYFEEFPEPGCHSYSGEEAASIYPQNPPEARDQTAGFAPSHQYDQSYNQYQYRDQVYAPAPPAPAEDPYYSTDDIPQRYSYNQPAHAVKRPADPYDYPTHKMMRM